MFPQFVDCAGGRIFLLLHRQAPSHGQSCVLFVPPFGEEMNKSRRQIALTAQALVAAGLSAMTVDLYGTGDSDGDFSAANWETWKANITTAARWAYEQGSYVEAVVGVRLGCLLAADSLRDAGISVRRSVFWQPIDNGRQFVTQFLRLRVAASMMTGNAETIESLRASLERGESIEVAGYDLSPTLWRQLEQVEMSDALRPHLGDVTVMEVGRAERELSAASQRIVTAALRNGVSARGLRVAGEPFWGGTEIVVNSALCSATVQSFVQ